MAKKPPNPNSLKNLTPIKPGEVKNPTGKNGSEWKTAFRKFFGEERDLDITDPAIKAFLEAKDPKAKADAKKKVRTAFRYDNVLMSLYRRAVGGEADAQEFIVNHMQGTATASVEMSGPGGSPLTMGPPGVVLYSPSNGRDPTAEVTTEQPPVSSDDDHEPEDGQEAPGAGDAADE